MQQDLEQATDTVVSGGDSGSEKEQVHQKQDEQLSAESCQQSADENAAPFDFGQLSEPRVRRMKLLFPLS